MSETSTFTGEGFDSMPSLYADNTLVGEFSDERFTDEVLSRKADEYEKFLKQDDLMPRAKEEAERVMNHLLFEKMYRAGLFTEKSHDG